MSDDVLKEHHRRFAEEQGRTCCIYDRPEGMKALMNNAVEQFPIKVLEIGPGDNPTVLPPKQDRGRVKYFEVFDAPEIARRALEVNHRPFQNTPEKIDYVSPTGDLSIIKETFDIVFSSHSIEHQMNLIKHLQAVERLLNDGGLFVLVIPDKRYCYDHFRQETTISTVLDRYFRNVEFRPFEDFIDVRMHVTHNNAIQHWFGIHGNIDDHFTHENFDKYCREYQKSRDANEYIDAHSLRLTPRAFERIVNYVHQMGLTRLAMYRLCHTVWGRFEFSAVLKKV